MSEDNVNRIKAMVVQATHRLIKSYKLAEEVPCAVTIILHNPAGKLLVAECVSGTYEELIEFRDSLERDKHDEAPIYTAVVDLLDKAEGLNNERTN